MRRGSVFEGRQWLGRVHKNRPTGPIVGAAFAIDGRHLLTCAHVVHSAGGSGPGARIWITLLFDGGRELEAEVIVEGWCAVPGANEPMSEGDTALLRIADDERDLSPLPITASRPPQAVRISSYGFPARGPQSDSAEGEIGRPVGLNWLRIDQVGAAKIEYGFSGGPAWVDDVAGAVGMVVARDENDPRSAYMIPLESLARDSVVVHQALLSSPLAWMSHMTTALDDVALNQLGLLRERAQDFVGRRWAIDRLDEQIGDVNFASGYIFIEGDPGIGKSSILAHLALERGLPFHFNVFTDNLRSPRIFLHNVCAQIISKYRLGREQLPPGTGESSAVLIRLLEEAAQNTPEPVIVLVDALDEAELRPYPGVNKLLLPARLPQHCFIVITNRVGVERDVDVDHAVKEIFIRETSSENEGDVKEYCHLMFQRALERGKPAPQPGPERDALIETVWAKSGGNFMYVRTVLPEILDNGAGPKDVAAKLKKLPQGLIPYYERQWSRMNLARNKRFSTLYEPIICFMAVALQPVKAADIANWMKGSDFPNTEEEKIIKVLDHEWKQYVRRSSDPEPRYSIYHASFLEFLSGKVNLKAYEARIEQTMLKELGLNEG